MLAELEKHPWTGAGFAAFWSPENYARLELIIGGSAVSAHNGYLEELLNTGIVGLAQLLRCVVVLWQAHRADPFRWLAFMFLARACPRDIPGSVCCKILRWSDGPARFTGPVFWKRKISDGSAISSRRAKNDRRYR